MAIISEYYVMYNEINESINFSRIRIGERTNKDKTNKNE